MVPSTPPHPTSSEGQITSTQTNVIQRYALSRNTPDGGVRVMRTPCLATRDAVQVGSIEWGKIPNNEIEVSGEVIAPPSMAGDPDDIWLKLAPSFYHHLRDSYGFEEHDALTEGYVKKTSQMHGDLFELVPSTHTGSGIPASSRPRHPAFQFGSLRNSLPPTMHPITTPPVKRSSNLKSSASTASTQSQDTVTTPMVRKYVMQRTIPTGGSRVRRGPSLESEQVGSIAWRSHPKDEIEVSGQVETPSSESGDPSITWLKLAPTFYHRLRDSYSFREHDPLTEGYVMMSHPVQGRLFEIVEDSTPRGSAMSAQVKNSQPSLGGVSTTPEPDFRASGPPESTTLIPPVTNSERCSLASALSDLQTARQGQAMSDDEYDHRRNDILSKFVTFQ